MKNLLIVDDDEKTLKGFRRVLSDDFNLTTASRSYEALIKAHQTKYKVVIADYKMPEINGLDFLKEIKKISSDTIRILISGNIDLTSSLEAINKIGVFNYLTKPFSTNETKEIIEKAFNQYDINKRTSLVCELVKSLDSQTSIEPKKLERNDIFFDDKNNLINEISKSLHNLGISANRKGYNFLKEAILLAVEDIQIINHMTKCLYPKIAQNFNTTTAVVESAMRNAIKSGFSSINHKKAKEIFGNSIKYDRKKPTNSEFVAIMAEKIRMKNHVY